MDARGSRGSLVAAFAAGIAAFAIAAPAASAAGYSVTGTGDSSSACTPSGSDFSCPTLRSAIAAVNAAGGTNTITLPAGTITLSGGQLAITGGLALTVQGAGPGKTIIDGGGAGRIFQVNHGNFTVSGVTLQHGAATGDSANGGGIDDEAVGNSLTVGTSTLDRNSASGSGGSIYALAAGAVTVTDSTISNSSAGSDGGGIYAANLVMSGSTVDGNTATRGNGGGVLITKVEKFSICDVIPLFCGGIGGFRHVQTSVQGTVNPSISNSTIVGNSTGDGEGSGGGIALVPDVTQFPTAGVQAKLAHAAQLKPPMNISGLVSLVGDTIVANTSTAGNGGNISQPFELFFTMPVWIQGTIIGAGQADGPNNCDLTSFDMFDGGSNLVFSTSTNDKCFPSNAFHPGNDVLPGDPRLANGPGLETDSSGKFLVADNGGPTLTIALMPGSPAIDAVTSVPQHQPDAPVHALQLNTTPDCTVDGTGLALATDQRGVQRPDVSGTGCDIGAYETGAAPLTLTGSVSPNPAVGNPVTYSFTANNSGPAHGTHGTFQVTLPTGATFDSATASQGSCSQTSATTVDCSVGVIPDGSQSIAVAITPNAGGTYAVTATAADRESGSSAPFTLSATVNAAAKGGPTTAASIIAPKPSTQGHACVSRRNFAIHVQHLRRFGIVSATVYLNGLAVRTVHGRHMSTPIDLRQLPKGTFTVTIVAHQRNGHVLRGKRTYHTCAARLAGHKHLRL